MKLSVVIVNYNVKYFLEQALYSVKKACNGIDAEIIVVDNHSVDGSCEMVKHKFVNQVILIENKENVGFSKANNQAIRIAKGEFILLLNPDTVVEEACFSKTIAFMEQTPNAGCVGVKMIDGSGKFLPESKRGLPTPTVAFYKIFGLAALFPKSKRFGKYHLGFLDKNKTHQVDVLAGAFMMLRKSVLDKIGLLDEDYFMYGEDIDLSYRVTKAGYFNYYFPDTTIIHYKGESTKKTSVNFVFTFYRAMIIFAQKHYSQKHAQTFGILINFAIYLRATASIIIRLINKLYLPFIDLLLIIFSMFLISKAYSFYKFDTYTAYSLNLVLLNSTIYAGLWMLGLYLAGAYNKRKTFLSVTKGVLAGSLAIAVFYAFLDDSYRFSRAIIVLGTFSTIAMTYFDRFMLFWLKNGKLSFSFSNRLRTAIVGNYNEVSRVQDLLVKSKAKADYFGFISIDDKSVNDDQYLGNVSQLNEIVDVLKIEEIIFCSKDLAASQIIEWMGRMKQQELLFKIVPEESLFIIGSNNKNTPGDFYTIELNLSLSKAWEQQKKRLFDIFFSIFVLPFIPIIGLIIKNKTQFIKNWAQVLVGEKTWVGYAKADNIKLLPSLRQGVLNPIDNLTGKSYNAITIQKLNFLYAKDYSVEKDFLILIRSLRSWGN
ncbi:MAG: glycosyltransferase family 2 protein [Bacteroidia bacterium]|nr:glycosyltransferase family 2 protein [Bacteroidia bacterium]